MVLTAIPAGAASTPSGSGWLRFGHFVASEPPVDVKVDGTLLGSDIAFRDVTGYILVHSGENTVTVTTAVSGPDGTPIATINADVPSGGAITVAAFASTATSTSGGGTVAGGVTLSVFTDNLQSPPAGDAKVRVIHTIPGAPVVDTTLSSTKPAYDLAPVGYKQASPYVTIAAGTYDVVVSTQSGTKVAEGENWQAVAGRVITIVIVEASSGPTLEILSDAVGSSATPNGAMQTGFGGTAPKTNVALIAMFPVAGALIVLLVLAAFLRRRPGRHEMIPVKS
jgi:hypothetical protein